MRTSEHRSEGAAIRRRAPRIRVLAGTLLAGLILSLVAGMSVARAQLADQFTTNTAVVPGGTLTLAVTTPGVLITGTNIVACTATTPPPAATVAYTCPVGLN